MAFTNNGCYNCDIPCEQQEFDSRKELFECYEKCGKGKIKDMLSEIELNDENKKIIIDILDLISIKRLSNNSKR